MTRALQLAFAAMVFSAAACGQTVGVFLDFDSAPSKTSLEIMKKEVDALLRPAGVLLDWRLAAENRGDVSLADLVLLKFKGKCKAEAWSSGVEPGRTGTLGATKVAGGKVLPFSEVKCDAVKQALSYLRPEASTIERQKALGLAMGRVVAHELYHVLAQTTVHAARGLAQAAESLQDLVAARPVFLGVEASEAIRRALLR
jgi:hypothetical protein